LNTALRVIILTPTAFPNLTGNAISAERWRRALVQKGIVVNVIETQNLNPRGLVEALDRFHPDVVHAHHISRAGALMLNPLVAGKSGHLPFVVSPGGTDINLHVMKGEGMKIVSETCRRARSIIAQSPEIDRLLRELLPDLQERIAAVPKSFLWFGKDDFDLRAVAGCREEDVLFFMPAGIRPVKGNLECLCAMEKAHADCPKIRVVFAGPALDAAYAARFDKEIKRLDSFGKWIFQIPPQAMHAAYQGADVVLNHSRSEGLSNSLLEAMAAGRPVLASDIPGNRWLVEDKNGIGHCGFLFDPGDQAAFVRSVLRLASDPAFRESLAANGRQRAATWPGPSDEAHALLGIYEAAMGRP
jgi:glycosyltransferase involved in cell wall biosynthesis